MTVDGKPTCRLDYVATTFVVLMCLAIILPSRVQAGPCLGGGGPSAWCDYQQELYLHKEELCLHKCSVKFNCDELFDYTACATKCITKCNGVYAKLRATCGVYGYIPNNTCL